MLSWGGVRFAQCFVLCVTLAVFSRAGALNAQIPATRDTVQQRDLIDLLSSLVGKKPRLGDTVQIPGKLTFSLLPSVSANPAAGVSFGVSGVGAMRLGPKTETTMSTFGLSANYTTKGQFNLLLRSSVYGAKNRLKFEGDWRYLDTNQPTYGLGSVQPSSFESPMDFQLVRFYETGYLEAVPNILLGVGYHLDWHFDIVDRNAQNGVTTPYLQYNAGQPVTHSVSSGLSLNILTDTRDNPINPKH